MALVAYGSSGESGSDSDEESVRPPPSLSPVKTPKPAAARSTSLGLPPPKNTRSGEGSGRGGLGMSPSSFKTSTYSRVSEDVEDKRNRIGLRLPPPKTQNTDQDEPKAPRSSLFSTLPPPKSSSTATGSQSSRETGKTKPGALVAPRKREPVKIAIPALPERDSDEEDEPAPKKQKASMQGSGLASLLPAPKGSAAASIFNKKSVAPSSTVTSSSVKENTTIFNKKEDFVPYTLTKNKPATSTGMSSSKGAQGQNSTASPSTVVSKKKNPVGVGPAEPIQTASAAKLAKLNMLKKLTKEEDSAKDDGSDEEDQSRNFFSLGESKDDEASPSPDPEVAVPFPVEPTRNYSTAAGSSSVMPTSVASSTYPGPYVDPNQYTQYSEAGHYMQYNQPYDYSDYNQQSYSDDTVQEGSSQLQSPPQPVAGPYVQDEMFVRMQGKKNRGEEIKIIDVHEDSQRAKMEDWKIQMDAEEREFMLSRSKKSGKLPSRQQRNKHQITYLAFQAKERELELKNQWSQNRMTKRQTQAKYGF
ncbi:hypothetical protein Bbelb_386760 [Branchiostoma belcheri]|nr:hypothetical protein Bbelb_386760 [Branchiostoma belcheri]